MEEPTSRTSIPSQPGPKKVSPSSPPDADTKAGSPSLARQSSILADHSSEIVELLARFANQENRAERA
jgi:hypothetical protein